MPRQKGSIQPPAERCPGCGAMVYHFPCQTCRRNNISMPSAISPPTHHADHRLNTVRKVEDYCNTWFGPTRWRMTEVWSGKNRDCSVLVDALPVAWAKTWADVLRQLAGEGK